MLLRNMNEMRNDMDENLLYLQLLYRKLAILDMTYSGALAIIVVSIALCLYMGSKAFLFSGILVLSSVTVSLLLKGKRVKYKQRHKDVTEYIEYLLSDPRNREYYSTIPKYRKIGTGFKPKPGTRLTAHQ